MPQIDQLLGNWSTRFDERRIEALQHVRICLECQANELLDLPIGLVAIRFQQRRELRPATIRGRPEASRTRDPHLGRRERDRDDREAASASAPRRAAPGDVAAARVRRSGPRSSTARTRRAGPPTSPRSRRCRGEQPLHATRAGRDASVARIATTRYTTVDRRIPEDRVDAEEGRVGVVDLQLRVPEDLARRPLVEPDAGIRQRGRDERPEEAQHRSSAPGQRAKPTASKPNGSTNAARKIAPRRRSSVQRSASPVQPTTAASGSAIGPSSRARSSPRSSCQPSATTSDATTP